MALVICVALLPPVLECLAQPAYDFIRRASIADFLSPRLVNRTEMRRTLALIRLRLLMVDLG